MPDPKTPADKYRGRAEARARAINGLPTQEEEAARAERLERSQAAIQALAPQVSLPQLLRGLEQAKATTAQLQRGVRAGRTLAQQQAHERVQAARAAEHERRAYTATQAAWDAQKAAEAAADAAAIHAARDPP